MRNIIILSFLVLGLTKANAQNKQQHQTYFLDINQTGFIILPENIDWVDISTPFFDGEVSENILKLSFNNESRETNIGIKTERGLYHIQVYPVNQSSQSVVELYPQFAISNKSLQIMDEKIIAKQLISGIANKKRSIYNIGSFREGIQVNLNNIYTHGDYIILDIGIENKTKLSYDISNVSLRIEDKKITKSTISQEYFIKPIFIDHPKKVNKKERLYVVIDKVIYANSKNLIVSIDEEQVSSRKININIPYNFLLKSKNI